MPGGDGYVTFGGGPYGATATVAQAEPVEQVLQTAVQSVLNQRSKAAILEEKLRAMETSASLKEQQMNMMYGLKTQQMENQMSLNEARLGLAQDRIGIEREGMENRLDIARDQMNLKQDVINARSQKERDRMDAESNLLQATSQLDPSDPDYQKKIFGLIGDPRYEAALGDKYSAGSKLIGNLIQKHSESIDKQNDLRRKAFDAELKGLGFNTDVYGAYAYDPMMNPDGWKDKDTNGPVTENSKRVYWSRNPGTTTIDKRYYDSLISRWNSGVAGTVHQGFVNSGGTSAQLDAARAAVANKDQVGKPGGPTQAQLTKAYQVLGLPAP
jgi:hypothetical protein